MTLLSSSLLSSLDFRGTVASGPPSISSSGGRAREYSAEEWESQRERFSRLYNQPGLSLAQIQRIFKEHHGFDATQRQFKRRIKLWGLGRNIRAQDGQWMVEKEERRKEEGKKTRWLINDREVSEARFARIRRKIAKTRGVLDPTIPTPPTLTYYTPRSPSGQQPDTQRRPSYQASASHLVECFLCHDVTYGQENVIMQAFRAHVRSRHPGHDILRFLDGFEIAAQVPGTVRTTQQLPSNHCGYVHGVQTRWGDEGDIFVPVRLGRLCHAEGAGAPKPYLVLTHASSCLTLRAEPKQEVHTESTSLPNLISQDMSYPLDDEHVEFGVSSITFGNLQEDDDFDTYLNEMHIPTEEMSAFFEAWPPNDEDGEWTNWEADNLF